MASKRRRSRQSRRSRKHGNGNAYDRLVPFDTWVDALRWAAAEKPIFYQAPMDHRATRLWPKHTHPVTAASYEVRPRTIRIWPVGSTGRGRARTADPFTADAGHLDRFRRPA